MNKRTTFIHAIALGLLCLAMVKNLNAAVAQGEYWFTNSVGGADIGTLTDPWVVTNATTLATKYGNIPANSTIHFLPGSYATTGLTVKSGQRVLGAGIAQTIFALSGTNKTAFSGEYWTANSNMEIADLTVDATNAVTTAKAIFIYGHHNAIRRVRAINCGGSSATIISMAYDTGSQTDGNIIEDTIVELVRSGNSNGFSGYGESLTSKPFAGIVRNCRFTMSGDSGSSCIYLGGGRHVLLEGNTFENATYGLWNINKDLEYVSSAYNRFLNINYYPVYLTSYVFNNLSFVYNIFETTNSSGVSLLVQPGSGSTVSGTNIVAIGNQFRGATTDLAASIARVAGFSLLQNQISAGKTLQLTYVSNTNIFNNVDLDGKFHTGIGQVEPPNALTYRSTTTNPTPLQLSDKVLGVRASGVTNTLPLAASATGKDFIILAETHSTVVTPANGTETINGVTGNQTIPQYDAWRLISTGSAWIKY